MPGLALTTLAKTAVCLCYVVVLHKHCHTRRTYTHIFTYTHRACLFLCFGQEQGEPLWFGGVQQHTCSLFMLSLQASCGLPRCGLTQSAIPAHK